MAIPLNTGAAAVEEADGAGEICAGNAKGEVRIVDGSGVILISNYKPVEFNVG